MCCPANVKHLTFFWIWIWSFPFWHSLDGLEKEMHNDITHHGDSAYSRVFCHFFFYLRFSLPTSWTKGWAWFGWVMQVAY
jgi:hypothetical protein